MHPMLQMTVASGIIAFLAAVLMPIIPLNVRKVMVVLVVSGICYLTLFRGNEDGHRLMIEPFWSYRQWSAADVRWQIYMNIFLFIPYGAILKALGVKHPILVGLLTSIFIELMQYVFALGLCETDDVINNTMGSAIGCGLFMISDMVFKKVKARWKSR